MLHQYQRSECYSLFGLAVCSEIKFPNIRAESAPVERDVDIRYGTISGHTEARTGLTVFGAAALLNIPRVARFWIDDGKLIVVEPAHQASERDIRLYLLGSALGAILYQRGIFPLHANAIEISERAVAFCGASGSGKSTLAAWFNDHGHRILSDDVCAIASGDPLLVAPGLPRLRLWRDALEARGRSSAGLERSFSGEEKFDLPNDCQADRPLPLGVIYLLENRPNRIGEPVRIQAISGVNALDALLRNTYRGAFAEEMGIVDALLKWCATICRSTPIFRVDRDWDHQCMAQDVQLLANHAEGVLDRSSETRPSRSN